MKFARGSGILLHISSLPSAFGIGDFGGDAYRFIDFLAASSQQYWQLLPMGPTASAFANSPYMSISTFAGNPLFISPQAIVDSGLLSEKDLPEKPDFSDSQVNFDAVIPYKNALLQKAFASFSTSGEIRAFEKFRAGEPWLHDYALFLALKHECDGKPWNEWPSGAARHDPGYIASAEERLAVQMQYHTFVQYLFFEQWRQLHAHAASRNIRIIGDIPIYVAGDSADTWANQRFFKMNVKTLSLTHVAGVPPDYFSQTGQRWGNPLYRWEARGETRKTLHAWWLARLKHILRLTDIVRIDHFRGFESYWEIPADEETAIGGRWVTGPGKAFFRMMKTALGELPIIAEDLGLITKAVHDLREFCGFPGMKILQFAFDSDQDNSYLPHNFHDCNCVVYTGTHDNDTTAGWYQSNLVDEASKERAKRYAHSDGGEIHWDFIRMGFASVAQLAIIPAQDLLGCGTDCRMNTPSSRQGNWLWRCPRHLTDNSEAADRLRSETVFYARCNR